MNNKKIQVWLPLLFSLTMVAGMFFGYKMRDNMPGKSFFHTEQRRPLQEIIDLIRNKYVEDVDLNALSDTAIQAMLNKLDPHSVFIPASELQQVNDDLSGRFYGIGIEFGILDDTLNVMHVLKDGPSEKAGLVTGDKMLMIGDSIVTGKGNDSDKFIRLLRGERGSKVVIRILHGTEIRTVTISRGEIPLPSLDAAYMMDKTLGYIRLNKFSSSTYREFMDALVGLKKQGMQKLVLDLRDNGGGILEEATEIADEFLDGDKLITYTEGKHSAKKEYRCRRTGQFETGNLYILADEGTASASEILIGALQDWDRATIIGRRTFGKGLVQEQFDLSDGSAIRLTIAKYYTPIGRSIQRSYANGEKAYFDEVNNRFHEGDHQTGDSSGKMISKTYKTMKGKTVYGGGGITPDHYVAPDTSLYTTRYADLAAKGTVSRFAYHYYLQHQAALKNFTSVSAFNTGFTFTENDWKSFSDAAAADSIRADQFSPAERSGILNQAKSALARQMWRNEGYFEFLNVSDPTVKKARELISN